MRPLYLQSPLPVTVRWETPALSVRHRGRAPRLFPLARISRVLVSGPVEWETAALLACADRGIPITFLEGDGELRAYLFGTSQRRAGLLYRLTDLLDRPDWRDRYDTWRESMLSLARRSLLRRLGMDPMRSPRLEVLGDRIMLLLEAQIGPASTTSVERRILGYCHGIAAEALADAGLDAAHSRYIDEYLDLPGDIAVLLRWDLQPALITAVETGRIRGCVTTPQLVHFVEARSVRLHRLARGITSRLHRWLLEM